MEVLTGLTEITGVCVTLTVTAPVAEQLPLEAVTSYSLVFDGLTVKLCLLPKPFDHVYPDALPVTETVVEAPEHMELLADETVMLGVSVTVIVMVAVAEQLAPELAVTLYVVVEVGLTLTVAAEPKPLDHE